MDGTQEEARRLRPDVEVIEQRGRGKGDALQTAFAACTGDVIVMLDGDGSTDPREIPRFVAALCGGADFVKGSRYAQNGGSSDLTPTRRLGNSLLSWLSRSRLARLAAVVSCASCLAVMSSNIAR